MIPAITLGSIRDAGPCRNGWAKLLTGLGYTGGLYDPDCTVTLGQIAEINGAADAWWCVRCLDAGDIAVRRAVIAVLLRSVERAARHTTDQRVHDCISALRRWCDGENVDLAAAAWRAAGASSDAETIDGGDAAWAAYEAATAADGGDFGMAADASVYAAVSDDDRTDQVRDWIEATRAAS